MYCMQWLDHLKKTIKKPEKLRTKTDYTFPHKPTPAYINSKEELYQNTKPNPSFCFNRFSIYGLPNFSIGIPHKHEQMPTLISYR